MIGSIAAVFAKEQLNVDNMINKSKGDWAYTLIDLDTLDGKGYELLAELNAIEGVVKTRIVIEN
jgi:D-3-phosphoglycerate dehydrogenase